MLDREKVIKGLEICSEHGSWHGLDCKLNEAYKDCPYRGCETGCIVTIAKDAIALLKEHEHGETFTVIDTKTGEEADTYEIALHEDWAKHLCYCDMEGWAIEDDGTLLLVDECGRFAYADRERFKVVWDA